LVAGPADKRSQQGAANTVSLMAANYSGTVPNVREIVPRIRTEESRDASFTSWEKRPKSVRSGNEYRNSDQDFDWTRGTRTSPNAANS
jgi:hypothetical protein